jgi:hypothetical protein
MASEGGGLFSHFVAIAIAFVAIVLLMIMPYFIAAQPD